MRRLILVAGLLYALTASTPISTAEEVTERAHVRGQPIVQIITGSPTILGN